MQPRPLATYCLLASAIVLIALLLVTWQNHLTPAQAMMSISPGNNYSFLTAQVRDNEEALLVVDNATERLLVYGVDIRGARGRMELLATEDLQQLFNFESPTPKR